MLQIQMYTTLQCIVQKQCHYLSNSNTRIITIITAGNSVLNKQDLYFLAEDFCITGRHWKTEKWTQNLGVSTVGTLSALLQKAEWATSPEDFFFFLLYGPREGYSNDCPPAVPSHHSYPTGQRQSPSWSLFTAQDWRSLLRQPADSGRMFSMDLFFCAALFR